jgi:hypothetical protein
MKIASPIDGNWHEVSGSTTAEIATELNLYRTTGWCYKVNGVVRKSLGTVSEDDVIEMVDSTPDDYTAVQPNETKTVSKSSGDNG